MNHLDAFGADAVETMGLAMAMARRFLQARSAPQAQGDDHRRGLRQVRPDILHRPGYLDPGVSLGQDLQGGPGPDDFSRARG